MSPSTVFMAAGRLPIVVTTMRLLINFERDLGVGARDSTREHNSSTTGFHILAYRNVQRKFSAA